MLNSTITPKPSFHILSQDLKELIFEFLNLSDLHNLQLVSNDFHNLLKHNSILWSKQLFLKFLDYVPEEELLWEPALYLEKLTINEDNINFAAMPHSRGLIESHYTLKQQYQAFLNRFLLPHQTQDLITEIFNSFIKPVYPAPCLKRDIHFFTTSTTFQNFLTEVHFGLHSHLSPIDKRQLLVETVVDQIKTYPLQTPIKLDKLVPLRWYSTQKADCKCNHSEPHTTQRSATPRREAHRTNQSSALLEEFNSLVCGFPVKHCQEVTEYLTAIRKDSDLLYEYVRFWNGYVLATMNLNKLFLPFSKYVNSVYNDNCHHLPKFPEFSVWRVMIKAWLEHVFSPLSGRLCEAFRRVLDGIRSVNGYEDIVKELEANGTEEGIEESSCGLSQSIEKETELLATFYKTMADISCDEFTVFFEECTSTQTGTPKCMLNKVLVEDTHKIYKLCGELLISRPEEVFRFFKEDIKLAEEVFGAELACKIEGEQEAMIRETLIGYFEKNLKLVDSLPGGQVGSSAQSRWLKAFDIKELDLVDMLAALKMKVDREVLNRLLVKIGMESVPVSLLFHTMKVITEELRQKSMEQEEALQEVIERGFEKVEDKHRCLFALNRDPLELELRESRTKARQAQKL